MALDRVSKMDRVLSADTGNEGFILIDGWCLSGIELKNLSGHSWLGIKVKPAQVLNLGATVQMCAEETAEPAHLQATESAIITSWRDGAGIQDPIGSIVVVSKR